MDSLPRHIARLLSHRFICINCFHSPLLHTTFLVDSPACTTHQQLIYTLRMQEEVCCVLHRPNTTGAVCVRACQARNHDDWCPTNHNKSQQIAKCPSAQWNEHLVFQKRISSIQRRGKEVMFKTRQTLSYFLYSGAVSRANSPAFSKLN